MKDEITPPFVSAAFKLAEPGIMYQFRLWQDSSGAFYTLLGGDSRALASFTPGKTLSMTYYFQDKIKPSQDHLTRIVSADNCERPGGADQVRVEFEICKRKRSDHEIETE
ncbi:MAG: hypothetical protein MI747_04210 [Desulfobacterales bacterium]|nr:hypothetical protein [Desulfobacterales bacterium]